MVRSGTKLIIHRDIKNYIESIEGAIIYSSIIFWNICSVKIQNIKKIPNEVHLENTNV